MGSGVIRSALWVGVVGDALFDAFTILGGERRLGSNGGFQLEEQVLADTAEVGMLDDDGKSAGCAVGILLGHHLEVGHDGTGIGGECRSVILSFDMRHNPCGISGSGRALLPV